MRLILIYLFSTLLVWGSKQEKQSNALPNNSESFTDTTTANYLNEHGTLKIKQVTSNKIHAYFKNNTGHHWDTTFQLSNDNTIFEHSLVKGKKVYQNEFSFLFLSPDEAIVMDLSGIATLPMKTRIKALYTRPFFRADSITTIKGIVKRGKRAITLNGIFLENFMKDSYEDTIEVKGNLIKEKYPYSYYSTPKSPQGIFGDTNKVHYRLIMHDFKITNL